MTFPVAFENAGVPANVEDLAKQLGGMASGGEGSNTLEGRELLKMDKNDGTWSYGMDSIELEKSDRIAINPAGFKHGYISWAGERAKMAEVLGEKMAPLSEPAPSRESLPDTGEKWDEQLMFDAQIMDGEDSGTMLVYKSTAHGGKQAIRNLGRQIVAQISRNPKYPVPVVKLTNDSYTHKKYGLIYKPVFDIVDWLDYDGNPAEQEPKKITKSKTKTKAKTTKGKGKAKAKAKPEPVEEIEEDFIDDVEEEEILRDLDDADIPEDDYDDEDTELEVEKVQTTTRRRRRSA